MAPIWLPSTTTSARLTRCNKAIIAASAQADTGEFTFADLHHPHTCFDLESLIADDGAIDAHTALFDHAQSFRGGGAQIGLLEQLADTQRRAAQTEFWDVIRNAAFGAIDEIGQGVFGGLLGMEAGDNFLRQRDLDIARIFAL